MRLNPSQPRPDWNFKFLCFHWNQRFPGSLLSISWIFGRKKKKSLCVCKPLYSKLINLMPELSISLLPSEGMADILQFCLTWVNQSDKYCEPQTLSKKKLRVYKHMCDLFNLPCILFLLFLSGLWHNRKVLMTLGRHHFF